MGQAEPADEVVGRSTQSGTLWADVRIDPVEIALPAGVGYTLRAYRPARTLARPEIGGDSYPQDDFDAAAAAVARSRASDDDADGDDPDDGAMRRRGTEPDAYRQQTDDQDADDEAADEALAIAKDAEDAEDEEEANKEVPVFLGQKGRVFLFRDADKLVEFVRSEAGHDLRQLDSWTDLADRVGPDDVVPLDEDRYELDLVVENLRGGPDAWDATLILKAGEVARDLGYALRIEPIMIALASGTPLDDLDEALRGAQAGGIGSFFARRRLRKIPAQQSSLAWRTIIGKLSTAAEWRD